MTQAHYRHLEQAVAPLMKEIPFTKYQAMGMSAKRYRWDLLRRAGLITFICDELYQYLNDTHIDTALRRITNTL